MQHRDAPALADNKRTGNTPDQRQATAPAFFVSKRRMRQSSVIGQWFVFWAAVLAVGQVLGQSQPGFLHLQIAPGDVPVFEKNIAGFSPAPEKTGPAIFIFPLPDTAASPAICTSLLRFFREKSFLAASLDSLAGPSLRLALGPAMRWVRIRPAPGTDERWLAAAGFREKDFSDRPLDHASLLRAQEKLLETAENAGYPFASVRLDSIEIGAGGGVSANLQLTRNQYFAFGKIKLRGDLRLPRGYLPNYLGLREGSPYSRAKILRVPARLRDLPFVEMTANPTVTFAGNEAVPNLFLKRKKAGRFDFIIGLLPRTDASDGRVLLTGNLNAQFQNALNWGEKFSAELERLRPETQKLDVQASVPYLAGLPFGAEGRLAIFRRDSTWVDAMSDAGVQYFFEGTDRVKFFWENKSTFLQKVDTAAIRETRRLPANLDFRANSFGLETVFSRLDYRFNPRQGWAFTGLATAGFSTVRRNAEIENITDANDPNFSFSTLYDSLTVRTARFRLEGRAEIYLPVFERSTVKIAVRSGALLSPARPIFANEQYRLGGNKLLRGFDEESLFATRFVVGTLEYRLLIGQNSWLAAFADGGYLENLTDRTRSFLRPLGLGAGMTFETRAGIFGISMAVGSRQAGLEAIDFRAAKFHLGYVSLF